MRVTWDHHTNNAPYIPQGNAIAEREFGTIIGTARNLLLGARHLPAQLWAEAVKTAIYIKNRTPTDVFDGKGPLEVWQEKKLGNLLHMHEWGTLAFKHVKARFRPNKLAGRAKKMHLVGYNTKNKTYRLWDPADPLKIPNSAEVSFREKGTRDVPTPKAGYDPFLEPTRTIYQLGIEPIETVEEEVAPTPSQAQEPELRRSSRKSVPPKVLSLCTTTEVEYDQAEYA